MMQIHVNLLYLKSGSCRCLQGKEMAVPSMQRGPVGSIRDLTRRKRGWITSSGRMPLPPSMKAK